MSQNLWKRVPDDELVRLLSTHAYLMYKRKDPDLGFCLVFRHLLTGKYKCTYSRDPTFGYFDLSSIKELEEYLSG